MMKNVAIYARISTNQQTAEKQIQELREIARRSNWNIVAEFVDQGILGAKGGNARPQFHALLKAVQRGDFDMLMSWSVHQLGRSFDQLVKFLTQLHSMNCDLYLYKQGLNTLTPEGRAMFQMCGIFAEFDRSMPHEEVKPDLGQAKPASSKPGCRNSLKRQVVEMRQSGLRRAKIAEQLGVSKEVVDMVIHS